MNDLQPQQSDTQKNAIPCALLTDWQALSPWSILSFVMTSLRSIFTNGYALVPIFYAGWINDISLF